MKETKREEQEYHIEMCVCCGIEWNVSAQVKVKPYICPYCRNAERKEHRSQKNTAAWNGGQ